MNIEMRKTESLYLLIIGLLIVAHFRVGIPYSYWDAEHTPGWRMHHSWDETLNSFRAQSLIEKGYKENPFIAGFYNQLYLIVSAPLSRFISETYPLNNRIVIAERLLTVFSFGLVLLSFYILLRMCFTPHIAFWSWLCFFAGTGTYLSNAFFAKEDSFCQLTVIWILITWILFLRKPSLTKLYLSAVLIAVGAAIKQYPLLLSPLILPLLDSLPLKQNSKIKHLVGLAAVTLVMMLLLAPQYYLVSGDITGIGKELLTDQQSPSGFFGQLQSIALIIYRLILLRYRFVWLTVGAYLVVKYFLKERESKAAPHYNFLLQHKKWIFGFLIFYYGISLYKQSFYASVRYFLIAEMAMILIFGCLLERLFAVEQIKWKRILLAFVALVTFGFSLRSGNFNYTFFTAVQEETLKGAHFSNHDLLEAYLEQNKEFKPSKIYSDWYIVYPEGYDIHYVHHVPLGYALSAPVVERALHFNLINAPWSTKLIKEQKPDWVIKGVLPTEEQGATCLKLVHEIKRTFPKEYPTYLHAYLGIQSTMDELREKKKTEPKGMDIFVYDAKGCWRAD